MARKQTRVACRSVFKSGGSTSKSRFTQIWVELVNQLEKSKREDPPKT